MFDTVTVEEAISKGHKQITWPGLLVFLGLIALTMFIGSMDGMPVWVYPVGFIAAIVLAWLVWSYRVTKWKVWAFENVRNVHELKRRAIEANLIHKDGSVFNKTEIWSPEDKEKWEMLQSKFLKPDEYYVNDDLTIPTETIVRYSKVKKTSGLFLMSLIIVAGLFLLYQGENEILAMIALGIGLFAFYSELKKVTNRGVQILISNEGIQTVNTSFHRWEDVFNEDVVQEGSGKHTKYFLVYDHQGGSEKLELDDFEMGHKKLRKLLKVYRGRSISRMRRMGNMVE